MFAFVLCTCASAESQLHCISIILHGNNKNNKNCDNNDDDNNSNNNNYKSDNRQTYCIRLVLSVLPSVCKQLHGP